MQQTKQLIVDMAVLSVQFVKPALVPVGFFICLIIIEKVAS